MKPHQDSSRITNNRISATGRCLTTLVLSFTTQCQSAKMLQYVIANITYLLLAHIHSIDKVSTFKHQWNPIFSRPLLPTSNPVSSVLWRCWLSSRKGIWPAKTEWWGTGVVICLQRGANDLHIVQLMPLPPYHLLLH